MLGKVAVLTAGKERDSFTHLSDFFPAHNLRQKLPQSTRLPLPFGVHGLHVEIAGGEDSLGPQPGPPYHAVLGTRAAAPARRRNGSQSHAERPQGTHSELLPRRRHASGAREGKPPGPSSFPSPRHLESYPRRGGMRRGGSETVRGLRGRCRPAPAPVPRTDSSELHTRGSRGTRGRTGRALTTPPASAEMPEAVPDFPHREALLGAVGRWSGRTGVTQSLQRSCGSDGTHLRGRGLQKANCARSSDLSYWTSQCHSLAMSSSPTLTLHFHNVRVKDSLRSGN